MEPTSETCRNLMALALVSGAGRKLIHDAVQFAAVVQRPLNQLFGVPTVELATLPGPGHGPLFRALEACGAAERDRADGMLAFATEQGARHVTCTSPAYPPFLREALGNQAPPFFFYRGNEALFQEPGAAIVGTRRPSMEGQEWARQAAGFFAAEGVTVVSGGAAGIDMTAHEAAMHADGTTAVILPTGLLAWDEPRSLQVGLENGQVVVLSEWLPSATWSTHQAMGRNRSIAASARLTCVIEPGETGGSRYTAETTLAQKKPVFYWGGACRDGFLAHEPQAQALGGRYGALHRTPLFEALRAGSTGVAQGELF